MIALTGTPVLETERLILRAPIPSDAAAYMAYYTSDRSIYTGGPIDRRRAWDAFCAQFGHWATRGYGMFFLTYHDEDQPLGLVGHWFPETRPETEVGWILFEGHEGKGLAHEAARACVANGWDALGWERMVSYIAPENARSIALAERLGATLDTSARGLGPGKPALVYRHRRPS